MVPGQTGKVAQWVKVIATQAGDLSPILRTTWQKVRTSIHNLSSDCYMHTVTHTPSTPGTQINKYNLKIGKKVIVTTWGHKGLNYWESHPAGLT